MTDEAVELLFIGEFQFEFGVIVVNEGQFVSIDFNQPQFAWFERLPGEKRCIHHCEYNGTHEWLILPTLRKKFSG